MYSEKKQALAAELSLKRPAVLAVSGAHNSGKTTLLEKLIPLLRARGLKVGVIKHDGHDFTPDVPGTDSFRLREAGAEGVAVFSGNRYLLTEEFRLSDYLKNGNITHSVNMPEVHQPRAGGKRICIIHKNEPGMISQITALTTEAGLNIENMVNKSKKNMAYTMLDATGAVNDALAAKLSAIPAVVRVRIL